MIFKRGFSIVCVVLLGLLSTVRAEEVLKVGDEAPSFFARKVGGGDFFLSKVVGANARPASKCPVVLSFFTTSCIPCRKEIPFLHALEKEYGEIQFYLVNVGEEEHIVKKYISQMGFCLPVLQDKYGMVAKKYGATVTPTLVIIQADGRVVLYKHGFQEDDSEVITQTMQTLFRMPVQADAEPQGVSN